MLLLSQMGVCAAVLMPTIRFGRSLIKTASDSPIAGSAPGFGWWKLVIIPFVMVIGFVVLLFAALLLNVLMELMEWLAFSLRRCPNCRCRRWSWGFKRGFGL
jgi:hypothetical protein